MIKKIKRYFEYRRTLNEIYKLSDREIQDIGISRMMIEKKLQDHYFKS
jgi:uncharacterized protein YjiS (DUF1127 family)